MSQENVEIVREIYQALARRDAASAFAVYAEDIVWEPQRAIVFDSVYHGHEGVRRFWRDAVSVFEEVDFDVEELIDADDQIVAVIREREIGRTSRVPVEASHATIWTLANGKVLRMQVFDDRAEALEAVGLEEWASSRSMDHRLTRPEKKWLHGRGWTSRSAWRPCPRGVKALIGEPSPAPPMSDSGKSREPTAAGRVPVALAA